MDGKVLVFAGTVEGRRISEYLASRGVPVAACVATDYGRLVMPSIPGLEVLEGRLDLEAMRGMVGAYGLVVDATHPYAAQATLNIERACADSGVEYLRLSRPAASGGDRRAFGDMAAAVESLRGTEGNVLVATGAKELGELARLEGYRERCFVRILPSRESLEACFALGIEGRHVICMQGPFSLAMNVALIEEVGAHYLVTKDSGREGGFEEKLLASRQTGATLVVIARPGEDKGMSYGQIVEALNERLGLEPAVDGHFPIYLDLRGKDVVLVGGGGIAARRASVLSRFGPRLTVVAPELRGMMKPLHEAGIVAWRRKAYEPGDLRGALLVICATDRREVNSAAGGEARKLGIPVSVADSRDESSFYFPALVTGEKILASLVSTGGKDHGAVRRAAAELRTLLGRREADAAPAPRARPGSFPEGGD